MSYSDLYEFLDAMLPTSITESELKELTHLLYEDLSQYQDVTSKTWQYVDYLKEEHESSSIPTIPLKASLSTEPIVHYPSITEKRIFDDYHSSLDLIPIQLQFDSVPTFDEEKIKAIEYSMTQNYISQYVNLESLNPIKNKKIHLIHEIEKMEQKTDISYIHSYYNDIELKWQEGNFHLQFKKFKFIKPIGTKLKDVPTIEDWRTFKILPIQPSKKPKWLKEIEKLKHHLIIPQRIEPISFEPMDTPSRNDLKIDLSALVVNPINIEEIEDMLIDNIESVEKLSQRILEMNEKYYEEGYQLYLDVDDVVNGDTLISMKLMNQSSLNSNTYYPLMEQLQSEDEEYYPISKTDFNNHASEELSNALSYNNDRGHAWSNIWVDWYQRMLSHRRKREDVTLRKRSFESNIGVFNIISKDDDAKLTSIDEEVSQNLTSDMFV